MTSILNWLTSWVTAEPMTVEQEHQHMSQLDVSEIDSGWNYVEGEQDYLLKLRFELDQEARKRELESIHFTTQKKNMGFNDRKIEFDELVSLLPAGSTIGLPVASIRLGIMKAVVEMEKSKWLECMKQIYSRHHSENTLWLDFEASFPQTQFTKGKQGSVIDFTLMSYSADPLSGCLLVAVLQSWNKCIQGFLEGELGCQLDTNDVALLQTTLSQGIPRLIELHSKATRAVDTFQKMERLPSLWKAKEIEELEKKKTKTIDAKFEGQGGKVLPHERMTQPMAVLHSKINHIYDTHTTPSVSISPAEHMSHSAFERTKESLEVLLEGNTPPTATQKSEELD